LKRLFLNIETITSTSIGSQVGGTVVGGVQGNGCWSGLSGNSKSNNHIKNIDMKYDLAPRPILNN